MNISAYFSVHMLICIVASLCPEVQVNQALYQPESKVMATSFEEEIVEDYNEVVAQSYSNPPYISATLNLETVTTKYEYFQNTSTPIIYQLSTFDAGIIDLSYSGISASFSLYKINHYSAADRITYISDLNTSEQLVFLDGNTTYFLEFTSNVPGIHLFSITPSWITLQTPNINDLLIHLKAKSNSFFGATISVERYGFSHTSSIGTNAYITSQGVYTTADVLSNDLNFGFPIGEGFDERQVIVNTGYSFYSAIAYGKTYSQKIDQNGTSASRYFTFSGSFVSETTVVTCAHALLDKSPVSVNGSSAFSSSLGIKNMSFSPGASNYDISISSLYYLKYGRYNVTEAYLPASFVVRCQDYSYNNFAIENDWALCLTSENTIGQYPHSYFGISVPTFSSLSTARNAGYPILETNENVPNPVWMWESVPANRSISQGDFDDVFQSDDIYLNGGSSGGPLYRTFSYIENGSLITRAYHFGIACACDEDFLSNDCTSLFAKNSHYMVNLYNYLEENGNEIVQTN